MKLKALFASLGLLFLLIPAGCIFSPDDDGGGGGGDPPPGYEFPKDQETLIKNFGKAYQRMDIIPYGNILHRDYKFFYTQWDIQNGEDIPEFHIREDDVRIHEHMFSGSPHQRPNGDIIPAISGIEITLTRQSIWETETSGDFQGADRAVYEVSMEINRPAATTILVEGTTEFYAVKRDSTHSGIPTDYWQLIGQIDRTVNDE